jgi:hypothetical protein
LALPASASIQAIVSTYLTRHEVIESPLTVPNQPKRAVPGRRRPKSATREDRG